MADENPDSNIDPEFDEFIAAARERMKRWGASRIWRVGRGWFLKEKAAGEYARQINKQPIKYELNEE